MEKDSEIEAMDIEKGTVVKGCLPSVNENQIRSALQGLSVDRLEVIQFGHLMHQGWFCKFQVLTQRGAEA